MNLGFIRPLTQARAANRTADLDPSALGEALEPRHHHDVAEG